MTNETSRDGDLQAVVSSNISSLGQTVGASAKEDFRRRRVLLKESKAREPKALTGQCTAQIDDMVVERQNEA
jgi:flagellar basal body rod protein FlgC